MTRRAYGSGGGGSSGGGGGGGNYYGAYSGRPAAGVAGRIAYYTDSPVPQIDTGSTWRNIITPGFTMPEPELGGTARNAGTATLEKVANILRITPQASVLASRARVAAFSGDLSSFRIRMALAGGGSTATVGNTGHNDSGSWPVIYARGSSGNVASYGPRRSTGGDFLSRAVWTADGATFAGAATSTADTFARAWSYQPAIYQMRGNGTTVFYDFSIDGGQNWLNWTSEALTTPFGAGATVSEWGFGVDTITASGTVPTVFCYGAEVFETA